MSNRRLVVSVLTSIDGYLPNTRASLTVLPRGRTRCGSGRYDVVSHEVYDYDEV